MPRNAFNYLVMGLLIWLQSCIEFTDTSKPINHVVQSSMIIKVAIDAGHGMNNVGSGYDSGAVANGYQEADIALIWALSGQFILQSMGIPTFLTRVSDQQSAPLSARDNRANNAGCTHYISLHMNAAAPPKLPWQKPATGTETFYRDSVDMSFAGSILNEFTKVLKLRNRGVKHESQSQHPRLSVLDFGGAATLVEMGFITNRNDLARVTDRDNRIAVWKGIGNLLKEIQT